MKMKATFQGWQSRARAEPKSLEVRSRRTTAWEQVPDILLCVKSNSSNKSLHPSRLSTCPLSRLAQCVLTVPLPGSLSRAASQAAGVTRGAPESVFSGTFLVASWRNQYEVLQGRKDPADQGH